MNKKKVLSLNNNFDQFLSTGTEAISSIKEQRAKAYKSRVTKSLDIIERGITGLDKTVNGKRGLLRQLSFLQTDKKSISQDSVKASLEKILQGLHILSREINDQFVVIASKFAKPQQQTNFYINQDYLRELATVFCGEDVEVKSHRQSFFVSPKGLIRRLYLGRIASESGSPRKALGSPRRPSVSSPGFKLMDNRDTDPILGSCNDKKKPLLKRFYDVFAKLAVFDRQLAKAVQLLGVDVSGETMFMPQNLGELE